MGDFSIAFLLLELFYISLFLLLEKLTVFNGDGFGHRRAYGIVNTIALFFFFFERIKILTFPTGEMSIFDPTLNMSINGNF